MLFTEEFVKAEVAYRRSRLLESAVRQKNRRTARTGTPVAGRARRWWAGHAYSVR